MSTYTVERRSKKYFAEFLEELLSIMPAQALVTVESIIDIGDLQLQAQTMPIDTSVPFPKGSESASLVTMLVTEGLKQQLVRCVKTVPNPELYFEHLWVSHRGALVVEGYDFLSQVHFRGLVTGEKLKDWKIRGLIRKWEAGSELPPHGDRG